MQVHTFLQRFWLLPIRFAHGRADTGLHARHILHDLCKCSDNLLLTDWQRDDKSIFEGLKALSIKINGQFQGNLLLHLQGIVLHLEDEAAAEIYCLLSFYKRQQTFPKYWHLCNKLHGVTFQVITFKWQVVNKCNIVLGTVSMNVTHSYHSQWLMSPPCF